MNSLEIHTYMDVFPLKILPKMFLISQVLPETSTSLEVDSESLALNLVFKAALIKRLWWTCSCVPLETSGKNKFSFQQAVSGMPYLETQPAQARWSESLQEELWLLVLAPWPPTTSQQRSESSWKRMLWTSAESVVGGTELSPNCRLMNKTNDSYWFQSWSFGVKQEITGTFKSDNTWKYIK